MNDQVRIIQKVDILHDNILSVDRALKYDFMTSLQNMAVAKIVTSMWMSHNIQQKIVDMFHLDFELKRHSIKWQQVKIDIVSAISKLLLPKSIKNKLTNIVPCIGKYIFIWIEYTDEKILDTNKYSEYSAVDFINNIIWTARGKIDYAQTAKNILANQGSCLSEDHKYKLACTYCLKDEIVIIAPNIIGLNYLDSLYIDTHPMVFFWTAQVTGDNTKLQCASYECDLIQRNSSMSDNEYITQLLIYDDPCVNKTCIEVPIRFMWNKLSEEEKAKHIILLFKVCDQDLRCSLLSNLNYEQQQEVFKECYHQILVDILDDWLWIEYFLPTAFYALNIMNPEDYYGILYLVNQKMRKNSQEENICLYEKYKSIFKQLWQESSRNFKDYIFDENNGSVVERLVTHSLCWKRDMDVIRLILNDLNLQQKKNIIFGCHGIEICADFIQNDQWDLLELFIKCTLSSEEDISQLKKTLISKGDEIALHFLEQKALNKIEYFMSWAFESEEDIDQFRQNLVHAICKTTLKSIIANIKIDFAELENNFNWCAKGDPEVINQIKTEFPSGLIEEDQYELLDQVLNWCFLDNKKQIVCFKSNMYKDDNLSCSVVLLIVKLIKKDNSFRLLNKFVDWAFTNEQEVQEFKAWALYPRKKINSVCAILLVGYQFKLANKFINWCGLSSEAVSVYKKALMLSSKEMEYIITSAENDIYSRIYTLDYLRLLIKWFNPSKEIAKEFKTLIPESPDNFNFFCVLDEFMKNQESLVKDGGESVSPNLCACIDCQSTGCSDS